MNKLKLEKERWKMSKNELPLFHISFQYLVVKLLIIHLGNIQIIESFYETKFVTQKCVLEQIQQQPEKRKEKPQHRSRIMMQ
ncbi:hypothetical protein BLOT_013070 [Blomia tropicalis]|nr:hypothetical protein BLOT_013070 [Blomia tropicalis]